jgi:hypothetical protein
MTGVNDMMTFMLFKLLVRKGNATNVRKISDCNYGISLF